MFSSVVTIFIFNIRVLTGNAIDVGTIRGLTGLSQPVQIKQIAVCSDKLIGVIQNHINKIMQHSWTERFKQTKLNIGNQLPCSLFL